MRYPLNAMQAVAKNVTSFRLVTFQVKRAVRISVAIPNRKTGNLMAKYSAPRPLIDHWMNNVFSG